MTKLQFDSLYYGKAVHCDTEEKAKEFLALADSVGYKWITENDLIKFSEWEIYKKETCYELTEHGLMFADFDFYKYENYEFVEYQLQPQPKFKVGDKIRVKDTVFTDINGKVGVIERIDMLSILPYCVKIDGDGERILFLTEDELEKVNEPTHKEETTETIIDEIKAKWSEINILLNRLEKKEKGE